MIRNKCILVVILAPTLFLTTACGSNPASDGTASSDSQYERERVARFTDGYCEFVNDLTNSSGLFYSVMNSGMAFTKGQLYSGSWTYRIGEMLKINNLTGTPEGDWISGYADYFETLDTKFKENDVRPTKVELGKLGALVSALQSQKTGFPKWDACSSEYQPSTAEMKSLIEANSTYKDFLENPKK
jgi:hypothetical protein